MMPATRPPPRRDDVRLLTIDAISGVLRDARFADLAEQLVPGDLLVVNDAATLPASLPARGPGGDSLEVRLIGPHPEDDKRWRTVILGAGTWRTPTEHRPAPPALELGARLTIGGADELAAEVAAVSTISPRLLELRFDRAGEALWSVLYGIGAPVQYAYLDDELPLWSVQTVYAARPWAAEMPSAGRPLTWAALRALRRRGIAIASLTHAAGPSSTGDPAIDAALPLPERFEIPQQTVDALGTAHRVIAVGTTVVRALESAALVRGGPHAGPGVAELVIDEAFRPRVVDGLLTGMHDPGESHYRLLRAFASDLVLRRAWRHAVAAGYRCHELGDATLLLPGGRSRDAQASVS